MNLYLFLLYNLYEKLLYSERWKQFINSKNKCRYWQNEQAIRTIVAAAAKSLQSCLTLCDPIDSSPPSSAVPGILQARTLEWVAISFSNAWKWKVKVKSLSRVRPLATPWAAYQAPPSMGFSRQEYRSGVPLPSHCYMIPQILVLLPYSIIPHNFSSDFNCPKNSSCVCFAQCDISSI